MPRLVFDQRDLTLLLSEVHAFHGQEIYTGLEAGIARKKKPFRLLFPLVRAFSRSRLGNAAMLLAVLIFFRGFRKPERGKALFQYGLSENNLKAFRRLNLCLAEEVRAQISINAISPSLSDRLSTILRSGSIWDCSDILSEHRHPYALPHLQGVIALATALFYSQHRFLDEIKLLCVASDHSPVCQAMLFVARQQSIKTCYVQHAPVTHYFPPLSFDISFLFDMASKGAYAMAARRQKLKPPENVTMLPPFVDSFRLPNLEDPPYSIGICLSFVPKVGRVAQIIDEVCQHDSVRSVLLRRHPRCAQDLALLLKNPKVKMRAQGEAVQDFLDAIDIALVPNSGVAIEALHNGRPTFYISHADDLAYDYYRFVEKGIIPEFSVEDLSRPEKLIEFFDSEWQTRFSDHDETVGKDLNAVRAVVAGKIGDLLGGRSQNV